MLSNWIYLILIAIVIVTVLVCIIKFPQARVYVFTFLAIILVGATIYSGVNLHYYYSSEGGIFGYISGIFDTNVVEVEELSFSLKNIEMTQESEEIYSAKVLNPSAISKLEVGEEYSVYVNGQPCSNVTTASDYVTANYEYSFLDEEMTELCHDELSIKFAFYENGTYMSVSTAGGSTAVKYWNYYFQKQNFVVDIKISEYKSSGNNYVDGEYDAENIMRISYIVEGKKEFGQAYPIGSSLTFPEFNNPKFSCWSTTPKEEGINKVEESDKFYADTKLYAILLYEVTFDSYMQEIEPQYLDDGEEVVFPAPLSNEDLVFEGYFVNDEEIDIQNYSVLGNTHIEMKYSYYQPTSAEMTKLSSIVQGTSAVSINLTKYCGSYDITGTAIATEYANYNMDRIFVFYSSSAQCYYLVAFAGYYSNIQEVLASIDSVSIAKYGSKKFTQIVSNSFDDLKDADSNAIDLTAYEDYFVDYYNKITNSKVETIDETSFVFKYNKGTKSGVAFYGFDFIIVEKDGMIYLDCLMYGVQFTSYAELFKSLAN